ncbi:MAG: hypothetical protein CM1200mP26_00990 [Acidimicrobiales bacterium]|nr:MAG: hypothetical protein CM1200mP26_00990 [Acidimicrobiales bacterium]
MRIARELLNDGNALTGLPGGETPEGQAIGNCSTDGVAGCQAPVACRPRRHPRDREAMPPGGPPSPGRHGCDRDRAADRSPEPKGARRVFRTWPGGLAGALQAVQEKGGVRARA